MIRNILNWIRNFFTKPSSATRDNSLVEPEPVRDFSPLKESFDTLLDNLRDHEKEIIKDITFLKGSVNLSIGDRRAIKHLHEELDAIQHDILAVKTNRNSEFPG